MRKLGGKIVIIAAVFGCAAAFPQDNAFNDGAPLFEPPTMEPSNGVPQIDPAAGATEQPLDIQADDPGAQSMELPPFPENPPEATAGDNPLASEFADQNNSDQFAQSATPPPQESNPQSPESDPVFEQPSFDDPLPDQPANDDPGALNQSPAGNDPGQSDPPMDNVSPSYNDQGAVDMGNQTNDPPPPPPEPIAPTDEQNPP
jgi:hypothetical protein